MPRKKTFITVTDQFCGAGGSSQGVRMVAKEKKLGTGLEVKLAMNHWKLAIETHNTNFPNTDHVCTDISACDPRRYLSTDILITSPECTVHSPAGGGQSKKKMFGNQLHLSGKLASEIAEERSRATMWDVCRFAEYHQYNIIIVENVVEARKWILFDTWLQAMFNLGYEHEIKYINSMHAHPTPQSRDRMYCVFWKKGNKKPNLEFSPMAPCKRCSKNVATYQWWKNPSKLFGKYRWQYLFKCRECDEVVEPYFHAAFNCIDWSKPGTRIGDRKRPLSPKTTERCEYGIDKYWTKPDLSNVPAIISSRYISGISCRVKSSLDPLPVQVTDVRESLLFHPLIIGTSHTNSPVGKGMEKSSAEAMTTQTTQQDKMVVISPAMLIKNYGGNFQRENAPILPSEELDTITTSDHHGLLRAPIIVENHGTSKSRSSVERLPALTTEPKHGIISDRSFNSFISYYNGKPQASHVIEAMNSITTVERLHIVNQPYEKPKLEDCFYRMLLPHEIQLGMAFDEDYIVLGDSRQKVRQLGNAVTPPVMKFLVERCIETLQ